jgi:GNAT superfamily N-acetyltransferase
MHLTVTLLADSLDSADAIAMLRWREWGHPPEPEDPAWWLEVTLAEAGREELPVTFVAHDHNGAVLGAVGLDTYDLDERHDTTPWVTGMIVRPDLRRQGIGRDLMRDLERWAADHHIADAWVGTDSAAGFYEKCGWIPQESFIKSTGQHIEVLRKHL